MEDRDILEEDGFSTRLNGQIGRMDENTGDADIAILRRRDAAALSEAQAWEALASTGVRPLLSPLTVAVKACFDVAGWPTTAGSRVLEDVGPAERDASLVAALRQHGAVVTSQTNMTEFAFGALGLNTSLGTPRSPLDAARQRIAGGSTSGGAVAVALGFADVALGSDTSGSIRIPAAFCGLPGFKPSHGRYDRSGMLFLSPTFDVPGFIARDISTLRRVDHALTGETLQAETAPVRGMRFLVPKNFALADADDIVSQIFQRACESLAAAGATIAEEDFAELASYGAAAVEGGIIVSEAYAWHRPYLEAKGDLYDPRVGPRIMLGADIKAHAYFTALKRLSAFSDSYHRRMADFDALLTPTVPIVPPKFDEVAADEPYYRLNRLTFKLTEIANRIDAPSVTLPADLSQPAGVMLTGHKGWDGRLLHLSQAVEAAFRTSFKQHSE